MTDMLQNGANLDIFITLREELLTLAIKPGEQIEESAICERFNASRPPVRNAFRRLSDMGLVDIIPYKGVYASLLDLDYIHQMIHMRTTIEGKVIVDFIQSNPDPFVIEELEHNIRKQQILIKQPDVDMKDFYILDSMMHSIWFTDRKCSDIWNLIQQQEIHYTRFRMLDFFATQKYEEIVASHVELFKAIKDRQVDQIDTILGRHLNAGLRRMGKKLLTEYGHYFKHPKHEAYWKEYTREYFKIPHSSST